MATNQNFFNTKTYISEDWQNGYKLEVDLTAKSNLDDWQLDFKLPHSVKEVYGVDLIDNDNGSFSISGLNGQKDLRLGQSIKAIFIIDGASAKASLPKFTSADAQRIEQPKMFQPEITEELETNIVETAAKKVGQKGKFSYGEALQKNFLFLEANRSGDLGPDNRIEWRKDSTTKDGSTVGRDLEGGYFDAGDHVKFGQPMAASVNMLAWGGVEYTKAYKQSGQFDELLDAVKWGTDYFLKAHETKNGKTSKLWVQVGQGGSANDHGYWGAPRNRRGKHYTKSLCHRPE